KPAGHLRLTFDEQTAKQLASSLSAIEQLGPCLWLAGDEGTSIERLVSSDFANYGENTSFDLKRFFSLPGKKSEEIDLEGLSVDGDQLWLMGSHSYRRGVPKIGMSGADALA